MDLISKSNEGLKLTKALLLTLALANSARPQCDAIITNGGCTQSGNTTCCYTYQQSYCSSTAQYCDSYSRNCSTESASSYSYSISGYTECY